MNTPSLSPLGAASWCDAAWVRAAFVGMNAAAEVWRFAANRPVTRNLLGQMSSHATHVVCRELAVGTIEMRLSRVFTPDPSPRDLYPNILMQARATSGRSGRGRTSPPPRMLLAVPYPPLRLTITGTDPDTGHALCVGWNIRASAIIRSSSC